MIKICVLSSSHPWNDNRILYKEVASLAEKYEVELHARANFQRKKLGGVTIMGLSAVRMPRIRNVLTLLVRAMRSKARIFHIHDFYLLPVAVFLKFFCGRRVLYDVHENYSHVVVVRSPGPKIFRSIIARIVSFFEQLTLPILDGCIVAEKSYLSHIQPFNINTIQVLNYPIAIQPVELSAACGYQMVYSGVITEARGALYMIDFVDALKRLGVKECHLSIVGRYYGEKLDEKMRNSIRRLGLEKQISLNISATHMNYETIRKSYEGSNIGLAFLSRVPHYMYSVPTKFYEYMQHGLIVAASDFPLWTRFVDENDAGITMSCEDAESAATKLIEFSRTQNIPAIREENKKRAEQNYRWESEARKLLDFYGRLTGKGM